MKNRIYMPSVIFGFAMVFSLLLCYNAGRFSAQMPRPSLAGLWDGSYYESLEQFIERSVPGANSFKNLAVSLKKKAGRYEFNDIYVGEDILIKKTNEPNKSYIESNIKGISDFAKRNRIPTYCMVVPSKELIKREELPSYTPMVDQKKYLDQIYSRLAGVVSSIDVYQSLFSHKDEYIYYNTSDSLSSLGNFYVYKSVASRLGKQPRSIDDFKIETVSYDYYGDNFKDCEFKDIAPDLVSIYEYKSQSLGFSVRDMATNEEILSSLYDKEREGEDVVLGGYNPNITIESFRQKGRATIGNDGYKSTLLVVGDETAYKLLPFLAIHYDEIRFVDISKLSPHDIYRIDYNYYGQLAFIYSFDSFTSSDTPSRIKYTQSYY